MPSTETPAPASPIDQVAIQAIEHYMTRWEKAHPDHSQMGWVLARHDYLQSLLVSLWNDATDTAQKAAVSFATRNCR
jgi:hypothetical protein